MPNELNCDIFHWYIIRVFFILILKRKHDSRDCSLKINIIQKIDYGTIGFINSGPAAILTTDWPGKNKDVRKNHFIWITAYLYFNMFHLVWSNLHAFTRNSLYSLVYIVRIPTHIVYTHIVLVDIESVWDCCKKLGSRQPYSR